ncbi:MAG: hypothetical protein B1H03_00665 [Planctomycetales bacterium 4484_113]|nr:MAG: hypothetical protein B1H03_00665 [Planctomycetales bacterium 4484_113]
MKKVAILQARLNSSRMPRRVLADLAGRPVLLHILDRLQKSKELDEICVAIPEVPGEDELAQVVEKAGATLARGPEHDVLSRYRIAAYQTGAEMVVRGKADNPLVDVEMMDEQLRFLEENPQVEYVFTRGLPQGAGVESFHQRTLDKLDYLARTLEYRKHVTYYLLEHPQAFSVQVLEPPQGLRRPHYRLTLDTEEDYELLRTVYEELYQGEPIPLIEAVALLDARPELAKLNADVVSSPFRVEQFGAAFAKL